MKNYKIAGIESAQTVADFLKSDPEKFKIRTQNVFSGNDRISVKYHYGQSQVSITLPCDKIGQYHIAKDIHSVSSDRPFYIVFKTGIPVFCANSPEYCHLFVAITEKGIKFGNQVNWYVYNPGNKDYIPVLLETTSIKSRKLNVDGYEFVLVKNPFPSPGRDFFVGEYGTGWVVGYGATDQEAISKAKETIGDLSQSDIGCYARGHIDLITRFCGKNPEFIAPTIYKRRAETV